MFRDALFTWLQRNMDSFKEVWLVLIFESLSTSTTYYDLVVYIMMPRFRNGYQRRKWNPQAPFRDPASYVMYIFTLIPSGKDIPPFILSVYVKYQSTLA